MASPVADYEIEKKDDISRLWGHYSPQFSVPSDIDPEIPKDCETSFGLVLSRHGARYPTGKKSVKYNATIARIHKDVTSYSKDYKWIKDYVYELGANDLTRFGQEELYDSGKAFYKRYKDLAKKSEPFIRSSDSERVIMSSYNFTQAFYDSKDKPAADKFKDILIISEDEGAHNPLHRGLCEAFEDGWASHYKEDAKDEFQEVFVPSITKRLNDNLQGAKLTDSETLDLMDLCPFNTVNTKDAKKQSKFCDLFSTDEWRTYNYYMTLDKYYGYGDGNPMGPTQGVGYVNELIARLTRKPVVDNTSTNKTLDSDPKTFPLDRTLYADFTHDNDMVTIFAAMGLYKDTKALPKDKVVEAFDAGGFSSAWVVPFAARMYVEKLQCKKGKEEYVRVLINDRVMPLKQCGGDKYGRCELGKFVDSLSFARKGGRWDECDCPLAGIFD